MGPRSYLEDCGLEGIERLCNFLDILNRDRSMLLSGPGSYQLTFGAYGFDLISYVVARDCWSDGISSIVGAACFRAPLFLLTARFKSMKLVRSWRSNTRWGWSRPAGPRIWSVKYKGEVIVSFYNICSPVYKLEPLRG